MKVEASLLVAGVTAEVASGGKFAEFVADHVFGDVNWDELVSVVNGKSVADKLRRNHRSAAPCFDDGLLSALFHCSDLLFEFHADERTFF